jgi:cation diffusion facilitator family transporter
MKVRPPVNLPEDIAKKFKKADQLEWLSFSLMLSCVVVIYFTLGQSQAMRAVFIEDIIALVPPIAYLLATHFRFRKPNERFPYGYQSCVAVGFFVAAVALIGLGAMVFLEAVMKLIEREHPTIGMKELFGKQIWLGWIMIPALCYTIACEFTMGQLKKPYANDLHDKTLGADARMNRADFLTGLSGILGVTGVAFGFWWADSLAAAVIGFEVLRDGWENLHASITDLLDERPTDLEGEPDDVGEKLRRRVKTLSWVRDADVRLREEGNLVTGEVFVVPHTTDGITTRYAELQKVAREVDWRFYDLSFVPVDEL